MFSEKVSRVDVAIALGKIGPAAKDAVPALIKALNDPSEAVKREAARALVKIDPEIANKVADKEKKAIEAQQKWGFGLWIESIIRRVIETVFRAFLK